MQIRPLSETPIHRMRAVFDEEIDCWRRALHWDFAPSAALIEKFMTSQSLPGFVLVDGQECVGYAYQVAAKPVGFIGDLFVRGRWASRESYSRLLGASIEALRAWSGVRRIECQIFPFNIDTAPLFIEAGFEARERYFLTLDLAERARIPRPAATGVRLIPWSKTCFEAASRVVYDSYLESPDHALCYDYQSVEGCARFLRNLIDHPGCGAFDAENSLICLGPDGDVCGILITTRISSDTGMIPQVSVNRRWQSRGIGSLLLQRYFDSAERAGLRRVTLSVSESNVRAHDLYRRLGFRDAKTFYAFVWQDHAA